jgi:uncharacterized integral membrane protein
MSSLNGSPEWLFKLPEYISAVETAVLKAIGALLAILVVYEKLMKKWKEIRRLHKRR